MKKYSIGEVSSRLGLSRDTLRFYEKKGIIQPEKQKNGYRRYTYEDTRKLLDIMFYRKLNFSIEDINRILYQSSFPSYYSMIQEKITEEKRLLKQHRKSLIHLKYLEQLYRNIEQYFDRYHIRPMRRYYKMDNSTIIDKLKIYDYCYIYQEYQVHELSVRQTDEYFLFPENTASILGIEPKLKDYPFIQHEHCVYTVIASDKRTPEPKAVLDAADWAENQGYSLLGSAYSGFLLSCANHESMKEDQRQEAAAPIHYIELYLPIKPPGI